MLHFPKVIQLRQIRNKGLINYCEKAAYYNTSSGLSIKERKKKKNNTHINNNSNKKAIKTI